MKPPIHNTQANYLCVDHFGPDVRDTGGMETVLRTFADFSVGADSVRIHPTRSVKGMRKTLLLSLRAALSVMLMPRSHIIHVHLSEKGAFVREGALVLLARARGLTVVITNHGSKFVKFANRRPRLVVRILRASDLCLCLSQEAITVCDRLAPTVPKALIINPVVGDPSSPGADLTDEVVLFAGEVGARKGVDVLLEAWKQLTECRPDARLVIAGPPTSLEVPPLTNVESVGALGNEAVRRLMRSARVVVLPSRDEALPVVLTEALAAGRPFIATPVGGIPWLADGVQALVPAGDAKGLAAAMSDLLADPKLALERGEAGRKFHAAALSIEVADSAMRDHYAAARKHHQRRPKG